MQSFFERFQPQQHDEENKPALSVKMQQVLLLKKVTGILLWFVISLNVSLFSRDSDNKNWAYITLFLIKGVNVAAAIATGGKEGVSKGIETSVATVVGAIAGGI